MAYSSELTLSYDIKKTLILGKNNYIYDQLLSKQEQVNQDLIVIFNIH